MKVGFIGLGNMGAGMARSLIKAGHEVTVWNRSPEPGLARGRTLTSWPTLRLDLKNAGANVLDQEVVVDDGLVTSRNPADLPAFCARLIEEIAEGRHDGQARDARMAGQGMGAGA